MRKLDTLVADFFDIYKLIRQDEILKVIENKKNLEREFQNESRHQAIQSNKLSVRQLAE